MKQEKNKNLKSGFTLIELLVVVLIIGILSSIALPQYQMAVTKAKVASILPLMRSWKDALQVYKLQHGDYEVDNASALDVNWPNDWKDALTNNPCGDSMGCGNDYWYCFANEESTGYVYCEHRINEDSYFSIMTFQPDERIFEYHRGTMICVAGGDIVADKICKALGGNLSEVGLYEEAEERVYKLN